MLSYISRVAEEHARRPTCDLVSVSVVPGGRSLHEGLGRSAPSHLRHPDDLKDLVEPLFGHRVLLDPEAEFRGVNPLQVLVADRPGCKATRRAGCLIEMADRSAATWVERGKGWLAASCSSGHSLRAEYLMR